MSSDSREPRFRTMSEDEFYETLHALLLAADASGVDVRGGWAVFRDGERRTGWDVQVSGVSR